MDMQVNSVVPCQSHTPAGVGPNAKLNRMKVVVVVVVVVV